jgi:hypothetical protein
MRRKITLGFVVLAVICAVLLLRSSPAERDLEATRRALRREGFKVDLKEFDFSISAEVSNRAAKLATTARDPITKQFSPGWPNRALGDAPPLLNPIGTDTANAVWKSERLETSRRDGSDFWPELREALSANQMRLAAALEAACSGPIRFMPIGRGSPNPLLPYLADLRTLQRTFGWQTMLALHDDQKGVAWTNLLASTCLVTEYKPEAFEISQLVRVACAAVAFDILWNALQSRNWSDAQLAELQRRWTSAEFFSGLPDTAAWSRASGAASFRLERQAGPFADLTFKEVLHAPGNAWFGVRNYWKNRTIRRRTYEDEKAFLLFYRDRELEIRRAVLAPTWAKMRQLPGVTNVVEFNSANVSRATAMLHLQRLSLLFQRGGGRLLTRPAEIETRRRLMITALALERHRIRHGSYPVTLQELVPDFLASVPSDFMDGEALRYRRTADGYFVLYSVGLDCVDDGGRMRPSRGLSVGLADQWPTFLDLTPGTDLVWPCPASATDVERARREELEIEAEQLARQEEWLASEEWARTAKRQARVETILKIRPRPPGSEPQHRGQSLSEALRNEGSGSTNRLTLHDLLTLRHVATPAEPETITYELPIKYDVLTNFASLQLYIDPTPDEDSYEGCNVAQLECNRAANGNCSLSWSTLYESPGKHALQAGLALHTPFDRDEEILGPFTTFTVTNLCQFSLSSAHFDRDHGVTLYARLPESNGTYTVEMKSPAGELLKTISGDASNGLVKVHWNLVDDHGRTCTNVAFDSVVQLTLPGSGRSQKLRGP